MNIGSSTSALASRVSAPTSSDAASQVQAQAQVSVLKKANAVQADTVKTLIAGVGGKLNVVG
jgi:hypothetical protein